MRCNAWHGPTALVNITITAIFSVPRFLCWGSHFQIRFLPRSISVLFRIRLKLIYLLQEIVKERCLTINIWLYSLLAVEPKFQEKTADPLKNGQSNFIMRLPGSPSVMHGFLTSLIHRSTIKRQWSPSLMSYLAIGILATITGKKFEQLAQFLSRFIDVTQTNNSRILWKLMDALAEILVFM